MPTSSYIQPLNTATTPRDGALEHGLRRRARPRRAHRLMAVAVGLLLASLAHAAPPIGAPHGTSGSASGDRVSATEAQVPDGLSAADWGAIQRQMRLGRYEPQAVDGGYAAANPAHGLAIAYRRDGTTALTPRGGNGEAWRLGLRLASVGYERLRPAGEPASVDKDARTLTYQRGDGLTEWWVNGPDGLEQWFELDAPPSAGERAGPLRLALAVTGDFELTRNDDAVVFCHGDTDLTYAGLEVWDADGERLPAKMQVNGERLTLAIDDTGARYPVIVDPTVTQQAYLKASNTGGLDRFGFSVAVDGDTVVVGAPQEDSSATGVNGDETDNSADEAGAAYVFTRDGSGGWSQQAYLKASNTDGESRFDAGDQFGSAVAVAGDTVVVGADGEDSSATGVNGDQADNLADNAGAAYVFTREGSTWLQQAYLKASNTDGEDQGNMGDNFGRSVAVAGDTVVVGAAGEDSSATGVNGNETDNSAGDSGAAYVFTRDSSGTWSQQAYLKASNTDGGVLTDQFGDSVAVAGDTVVVGAELEDSSATGVDGDQGNDIDDGRGSGAAYVFTRGGNDNWSQQAYLKASNTGRFDRFGFSVAVAGDTVVVGARGEDSSATGVDGDQTDNSAPNAGAAYVFTREGSGTWSQQAYLKASNTDGGISTDGGDVFGSSVAVDGDTVVVAAPGEDSSAAGVDGDDTDNSLRSSGAAYVFTRDGGGTWSQQAYLKASNTGFQDFFGASVAVADTVVVGAWGEASSATGVDGDQADNAAGDAGAAYVLAGDSLDDLVFRDGFEG